MPLIFFCSNSICFSVHLPLHDHRAKPEPAMLLFLIYLFTIKESTKEYRLVTTYHLHHYHRGPPMTRLVTTVYSIPPPWQGQRRGSRIISTYHWSFPASTHLFFKIIVPVPIPMIRGTVEWCLKTPKVIALLFPMDKKYHYVANLMVLEWPF